MSKIQNGEYDIKSPAPSAPPSATVDDRSMQFAARAPPPSYEESQMMCSPMPQSNSHLQQIHPLAQYYPTSNGLYASGSTYQWQPAPPITPQHLPINHNNITSPVAQTRTVSAKCPVVQSNTSPKVLTLAKGAKIRTTSTGAVSIPPPPPGCAPTPAQYAAMQGQSVLVKKQKRSFF